MTTKTEKTAEQIEQDRSVAFEYGMGKCLRKVGAVKSAEDVQFFMQAAAAVAEGLQSQKKG